MGVLSRFERRLEGLVEGAFAKVFKGVVEPVEVANALQREAEDKKAIVGAGRVLVPNDYVVELGKHDGERLGPYADALGAELAQMVAEHAAERGWSFVGPVTVRLEELPDLDTGVFRVRSAVVSGPTPVPPPTPSGDPTQEAGAANAGRLVLSGPAGSGADGGVVALDRPETLVGRAPEADVRLSDTGVSRRHAVVRVADGDVVLEDLGSTNGTSVNGRPVERALLADGDRITVGTTTLVYRRDEPAGPPRGGG